MKKQLIEESVVDYIQALIPPFDDILQDCAQKCRLNRIPIVEPEVAQLLLFLIKSSRCKKILEIGTAAGYSAILIGKAISRYKRIVPGSTTMAHAIPGTLWCAKAST